MDIIITTGPMYVYSLWNKSECIYVGCSAHIFRRLYSHERNKKFDEVRITSFDSKKEARIREVELIAELRPTYNITRIPVSLIHLYNFDW